MQFFKGDEIEQKFYAAGAEILTQLSMQKDLFFEGAYEAMPLGDVLYTGNRTPLSRAIVQDIFRASFNSIFEAFARAGTFEAYLTVFTKIFGEDSVIEFVVPAPGKLTINIEANLELSNFLARYIEEGEYIFDNVIYNDEDGTGKILFRTVKGFESQYEVEQMLFEMVPNGIFTDINLTFGG